MQEKRDTLSLVASTTGLEINTEKIKTMKPPITQEGE